MMKTAKKILTLTLAAVLLTIAFSGCTSTRSENGVSIEQKRGLDSLKFW